MTCTQYHAHPLILSIIMGLSPVRWCGSTRPLPPPPLQLTQQRMILILIFYSVSRALVSTYCSLSRLLLFYYSYSFPPSSLIHLSYVFIVEDEWSSDSDKNKIAEHENKSTTPTTNTTSSTETKKKAVMVPISEAIYNHLSLEGKGILNPCHSLFCFLHCHVGVYLVLLSLCS